MKFKINFTEKFLKIYKYLICLTPFIFSIVVVSNNLVDFKGIFESGIYINMAKNWLNESNNEAPLRRLPLYPIFIYLIFKIFGTDNLIALLFFQSVLGYFTFLYLIKTLETLKVKNSVIIYTTLFLNLSIIFRFSVFLPNCLFIFLVTIFIYNFTNFYLTKKINYFFMMCLFLFLMMLTRPIFQFCIYITIPLICWFIIKNSFKNIIKIQLLILLFASYFAAIGVQYLRYHSQIKNVAYTTQKGQQLILWVLPCLSKKYGCGSRDMEIHKLLNERWQKKISEFDYVDEVEKSKIAWKIGTEYFLHEMDKTTALISAAFSFSKLLLHSSFTEIYPSFEVDVKNLSLQEGSNFFEKLKSFLLHGVFDFKYSIWIFAIFLVIISRLIQLYSIIIYMRKNPLKLYVLIITSMILVLILPSIGLGNPRYRSEIEILLIIIGALGIDNILQKIKSINKQ